MQRLPQTRLRLLRSPLQILVPLLQATGAPLSEVLLQADALELEAKKPEISHMISLEQTKSNPDLGVQLLLRPEVDLLPLRLDHSRSGVHVEAGRGDGAAGEGKVV